MDLLNLAKGYLTTTAIEKISQFLGENPGTVSSGISAALPTLLGGIMNSASTQDGLAGIMGLLKNNNATTVDNFSSALGNQNQMTGMLLGGKGLLESILGNNLSSIVGSVASFSGMKSSSTSSLLSMLAPLVMGLIGKQVSSQGLGLSGLATMLMGQKDSVKAAMPAGLTGVSSLFNFSGLGDYKSDANRVVNVKREVEREVGTAVATTGGFNWLPWVIGALLLAAAFWAFRNCSGTEVDEATEEVSESTSAIVDSSSAMATDVASAVGTGFANLGNFFARKLPNGIELNIPENGIENNLIKFIEDKNMDISKDMWFNFDRINFETGSDNLSAESKEQIKNIGEILKAYPAVNIKVGGYTDNTGSAATNAKLSDNRAKNVMNAIVAEGISKSRLTSEGYGQEHPVASNDTAEGKAQNRRIAVRVTAK